MPVKIPDTLPAAQTLTAENIFIMTDNRAAAQDIRPLKIAVFNLMPTKIATETQLLRLLGNTPLQVEVTLLRTASYEPKNTDKEHLVEFYKTFDEIKDQSFDGLIITGAPVEHMDFEEVTYWDELTKIMDWADKNVFSTFYICWAAQAALYYHYGIKKHPLNQKMFGVFEHKRLSRTHKLLRGFDDVFYAPHSRHTAVDVEDVMKHEELEVLSTSDEAGLYLAASNDGTRVFAMGHSEYDPRTLETEYLRDKGLGKDIKVPCNYYPNDDETQPPCVRWRSHSNLLFANWLNYFVYQETPYNIETIGSENQKKRSRS
ncbi:MAG: homoserine O-succinyltransferase [Clostridia bacterium]|nr:homoserine O-succinyltransferase [Clostridia bacterium]